MRHQKPLRKKHYLNQIMMQMWRVMIQLHLHWVSFWNVFLSRVWVPKFATGLYIIIKSACLSNLVTRIDYKHRNQFILNFLKALEPILLGVYWEFTLGILWVNWGYIWTILEQYWGYTGVILGVSDTWGIGTGSKNTHFCTSFEFLNSTGI